MKKIIRQVTFDGGNRRKDGTIALKFSTSIEQTTSDFMEIDDIRNTHGLLYYSERGELTKEELDALDKCDIEITGKSRSEKLRRKIMALHHATDSPEPKESYYRKWMDYFESVLDGKFPEP